MEFYKIYVKASWDDDAGVWYVAESNVPGLNAESKTQKGFERMLQQMVPELIELNGAASLGDPDDYDCKVPLELIYSQTREVALGC